MADDDPFARYAAQMERGGAQPRDASSDPFAKYTAPDAPGVGESVLRGVSEGLSFGYDDKLGVSKEHREASRKANPWAHFFGEVIGGAVPMIGAALLPTGATQAAAAGRGAQLVNRGLGLVRSALAPGEIVTAGQAIGQGAKLGAVYGGLSGSGHADVKDTDTWSDAIQKRGAGAVKDAALGTVFGGGLGAVGHGLYRAGQSIGGLRALSQAETADHGQGALHLATRKMEQDRVTPQQILEKIYEEFPSHTDIAKGGIARRFWGDATGARQPITREHVEEVVRRAANNESAAEISAAMKAASGGDGPGEQAVRTLLSELEQRYLGPAMLPDRVAMARPGGGTNTNLAMRAAAATQGEPASIGREALFERQVGSGSRLHDLLSRFVGTTDFDAAAARHSDDMASAASRGYGAAKAREEPFDLMPVIQKYQADFGNRRGPVPEAINKAISDFTIKEPTTRGVSALGRTEAAELPLAEREVMMEMWRYANRPMKSPQTLSQWVVANGGLRDPGGDIANVFGGHAPRGMLRPKSGSNLDDMALRAQHAGFFPGMVDDNGRPVVSRTTINEFIDALDNDIRGNKVVRLEDSDMLEAINNKYQMLRDLSDVGVTARTEMEAAQQLGFGTGKPGFTPRPPQSLQEFIDARQNIKQMIDDAKPGSPVHAKLTELYRELSDAVAVSNPQWKMANDLYREGAAAKEALEAGSKMAMSLNSGTRERLAFFTDAQKAVSKAERDLKKALAAVAKAESAQKKPTTAQLADVEHAQAMLAATQARVELFKVGLVRAISDRILNKGETHNLVQQLSLPAARKILGQVLGEDAPAFFRVIDAEKAFHKTYQSQFGSQTTPLREAIDELNWAPQFEASMLNPLTWGNPLIRLAQEAAARSINARRNTDLMKLYTETDPMKQVDALRLMQKLYTARSDAGNKIGKPVVGSAGVLPHATNHFATAEPPRANTTLKPYRQ